MPSKFLDCPKYVSFALKFLKNSDVRAEVSDKDGVFVLIKRQTHASMIQREAAGNCYVPISVTQLEVEQRIAMGCAYKVICLCKRQTIE